MADAPISALTSLTGSGVAVNDDTMPVVDSSATETKKITVKELIANTAAYSNSGTGANARSMQEKGRDEKDIFDDMTDAQRTDVTNSAATLDLTAKFTTALADYGSVVVKRPGIYRIDGTIKILEGKTLRLASRDVILKRVTAASSTDPIVTLLGSRASFLGNGTVQTQKACTTGVVAVGQSTSGDSAYYNVQLGRIGPHRLLGPGGSATNVGLYFKSHQPAGGGSYATYFTVVEPGMEIDSFGIDVKLPEGCNGHEFHGISHYNTYTKCYELQSAYGCKVFGGFAHTKDSASSGVTIISLLDGTGGINATTNNQFLGMGGEPGGTSTSANIAANCTNNTLILLHNTTSGPTDSGSGNIVIYNGNIAGGDFNAPVTKSQSLQSFVFQIVNVGGVIKHAFFSGASGNTSNFLAKISSASSTNTTTPTGADASTAFAAGAKISSVDTNRLVCDTADQATPANALMVASINYNDSTVNLCVQPRLTSRNVNGTTRTRLEFAFTNATTGAAYNLTTLGSGLTVAVSFLGYIQ